MKAIFKYNGAAGALLCSHCKVIIKIGKDFTDEEKAAIKGEIELDEQYCDECLEEMESTCQTCGGSGEGPADGTTCWKCKGSGV